MTPCERCGKQFAQVATIEFSYAKATVLMCFVCCALVVRVLADVDLHERPYYFAFLRERWKSQEKSA